MFAEAQRHLKMAMAIMSRLQSLVDPDIKPLKDTTNELDKKLKMLLHSDKWPIAVEARRLADPNSDDDKLIRAHAILDQVVDIQIDDKRFLDYGCGEGHVAYVASERASLSVGYDLQNMGWGQFPPQHNLFLTEDPSDHRPFDIILLHDVLDHVEEDPVSVLEHARDLLHPQGRICVYCHPFCSRSGGHNHKDINRAFAQLFFPEGLTGQRVLKPLEEYKSWFSAANLIVRHEKPLLGEVPKIFQLPHLLERIRTLYGEDHLPEEHLKIEAVIYSLSKEL